MEGFTVPFRTRFNVFYAFTTPGFICNTINIEGCDCQTWCHGQEHRGKKREKKERGRKEKGGKKEGRGGGEEGGKKRRGEGGGWGGRGLMHGAVGRSAFL